MINGRRAPKTRLGGSARCSVGAVALAWLLISLLSSPAQAQSPPSNPAPKQDSDPSRWAVIIGVNTYSQSRALHPLRGPGNDAKNLTDVLISHGRFAPDHVLVLADGTATPPTNDNITIAFSRVAKEVPEDGLLVIFFAGHGIAPGDEAYLLPSNVVDVENPQSHTFKRSALPVADVREFIESCRARNVILFIDACRNDPGQTRGINLDSKPLPDLKHSAAMQKALIWQPTAGARVRNIVTFFSSHPGQESFETGETAGHGSVGYFTDTLVNALSGKVPQTLQQPDNIVTVNSIYGYLTREVARRVAKDFPERTQNPFMYQSGGQDVALTFPTPACEPPASCPTGRLRLRLPRAALNNAGLVVTRNHFKVDQADLFGAMTVSPGPQYLQVKLPAYTDWSRDVQVLEGTVDVDVSLRPRRAPVLIGLGVAAGGVLAVAAGTYFGVRANSLGDEVTRLCANAGGECSTWTGTVKDKEEQGRRYDTYSKVMLFTGIPALLGGLGWAAYWHWTVAPLNPDSGTVAVTPLPTGGQISFQGTF